MPRDYRKEYLRDHASPQSKKHRAARNKARRDNGLKKGDGLEVDHINPLINGGSKSLSNQRVISRALNRKKGRGAVRKS